MIDFTTIFLALAALSFVACILFAVLAVNQKKRGAKAGGPSYKLFSWLALIVAVFFGFMVFITFEIRIM